MLLLCTIGLATNHIQVVSSIQIPAHRRAVVVRQSRVESKTIERRQGIVSPREFEDGHRPAYIRLPQGPASFLKTSGMRENHLIAKTSDGPIYSSERPRDPDQAPPDPTIAVGTKYILLTAYEYITVIDRAGKSRLD